MEDMFFEKVPLFMKGEIGKKYKFKSLHRDVYSSIRNRMKLSQQNGWADDNGEVYCLYGVLELCDELSVTDKPLKKAIDHLVDVGLMKVIRQGLKKPNMYYINRDVEERMNKELIEVLEKKKEEGSYRIGKTPNQDTSVDNKRIGEYPKQDEVLIHKESVNIRNKNRKNSELERSTLKRSTKKIKNNICFLGNLKAFSNDYVSLQDKSEEWFVNAAEKLEKEYDPSKGTPNAFIREHLCRNNLIEEGQADEVFVPEYKKESKEPKVKKQATVEDRLKAAITDKGYEHPHVVEGIMELVNKGNDYAKSLLPKLQRKKCLVNGKAGVTYTAEYSAYLNSNSNVLYSEFLTSYNPIMSNGKPLVV